jgi:hypothetical protein
MNKENKCCKYCLEEDKTNDPIIYPCKCSDGVHMSCLITWLKYSNHEEKANLLCEICKEKYEGIENEIILIENILASMPPLPQSLPPPPPPPPPTSPLVRNDFFEPEFQNPYVFNNNIHPIINNHIMRHQSTYARPQLCKKCDTTEKLFYTSFVISGLSAISFINVNNSKYNVFSLILTGVSGLCILIAMLSTKFRFERIYRENRYHFRRIQIAPRIT